MTREEVFEGLKEVLANVNAVNRDALNSATEESDIVVDLGITSSEIVNILAKTEERFDVEFDDDDIDELQNTIGATIDLVIKALE